MRLDIQFTDENNNGGNGALDKLPDTCPQCHHKIDPQKSAAFYKTKPKKIDDALEIVFRCPNLDCHEVFIGYYSKMSGQNLFYLQRTAPARYEERTFSQTIMGISYEFSRIYNQAFAAENANLDQVCGAGYRKALEFLIKDYLLKQTTNDKEKEEIKDEHLGTSIKNRIKDANIKEVAKRAVWLGNDETHYMRKWELQDLQDLKKLIDLTVHWMEAEALTNQLLQAMPDKQLQ
ncbi:DUF4145 domain-containing protein [Patescibacteria group bacterium]|nr:DUF4145 domain-containing protein [Patescibacteria group bacterium]